MPSALCIATVASWACVAVPLLPLRMSLQPQLVARRKVFTGAWIQFKFSTQVQQWDCECGDVPLIAVHADGSIAGRWHHLGITPASCRWNAGQVRPFKPMV